MAGFKGYALIASAAVLWGSASIAVSYALMGGMDRLSIATLMTAVGAVLIGLYAGREGFSNVRMDLIAYGALVVAAFRALYTLSISINGAGVTASLLYTAPLLVAALAPLSIREKPSLLDMLLAAIAVVGAYLSSNPDLRLTSAMGFIVGLALAVDYAVTIVAVKYFYGKGYSKKEVLAQPTIAAVPVLAALTLLSGPKIVLSPVTLLALLWGGAVSIGVALVMYMEGMRTVRALEASVIATLEPVSALLLARIILNEQYVPLQLVGIALILISAFGITLKNYISYKSR